MDVCTCGEYCCPDVIVEVKERGHVQEVSWNDRSMHWVCGRYTVCEKKDISGAYLDDIELPP